MFFDIRLVLYCIVCILSRPTREMHLSCWTAVCIGQALDERLLPDGTRDIDPMVGQC